MHLFTNVFYLSRLTFTLTRKFLLYTATDRCMFFSGTPVTYYLLNFGDLFVNTVHLLLTENIKTGNIVILYNYMFPVFNLRYKRQ